MRDSADVVIVGAGIVGASIAFNLTAQGCRDVVLLEREAHQGLGSTGKSMGGVRAQFGTDVSILMSRYSIPFYARFEAETGFPSEYRPHGYLFVASSATHMDYLRANVARQQALGLREVRLVTRVRCGSREAGLRGERPITAFRRPTPPFILTLVARCPGARSRVMTARHAGRAGVGSNAAASSGLHLDLSDERRPQERVVRQSPRRSRHARRPSGGPG